MIAQRKIDNLHDRYRLTSLGETADGSLVIGTVALEMSRAQVGQGHRFSDFPMGAYLRHLEALVRDVRSYAGNDGDCVPLQAEALCQVLARRYGYGATALDSEEEPDDGLLANVIDRRSGPPATLVVLYLHVAHALGWPAEAIDFPPRPMLRLGARQRLIIDPCYGARRLEIHELRAMLKADDGNGAELAFEQYKPLSSRALLGRIHNLVKNGYLCAGDLHGALRAIDIMCATDPAHGALWREAGLLQAKLGHLEQAVQAFEAFLEKAPGNEYRYEVSVLLQDLHLRLSRKVDR